MPVHYVDEGTPLWRQEWGWERPMLWEAVQILKDHKTLKDLLRAKAIVEKYGVVQLDLDEAIRWFNANPARAAGYLFGPTPEGRPGAMQDLMRIAKARGEF